MQKERIFSHGSKISEEVGELNEQILGIFDGQRQSKKENLENEIADIILTTIRLTRLLDLDAKKLLKNKIEKLKKRIENKQ